MSKHMQRHKECQNFSYYILSKNVKYKNSLKKQRTMNPQNKKTKKFIEAKNVTKDDLKRKQSRYFQFLSLGHLTHTFLENQLQMLFF